MKTLEQDGQVPDDFPGAMARVDDTARQWTERYRPQVPDDLIVPDYVKAAVDKVYRGELQTLLLAGRAGGGKTSIGKVILGSPYLETLWIDGAEGHGMEKLQGSMTGFAMTVAMRDYKVIILDEADQYPLQTLNALRGKRIEEWAEHCGLVLTCNELEKIPLAVQKRMQVVDFSAFSAEDLAMMKRKFLTRVSWIIHREDAKVHQGVADYVVEKYFPDMRTILRTLQNLPPEATPEWLLERDTQAEAPPKHRRLLVASPPLAPDTVVDGAALLNRIVKAVSERSLLPPGGAEIVALFAAHTHFIEAARFSPVLVLTSLEKGCGKSTVLQMLRLLVRDPLYVSNATAAGVFRELQDWRPTLIADEGDNYLDGDKNWNSLLHGGFARSGGHILRAVGRETIVYDPWGPKAIGRLGIVHPVLASRATILSMKPMTIEERRRRKKLLPADGPLFAVLKAELVHFAQVNLETLAGIEPELPAELHNRHGDVWNAYVAIADLVGGGWPKKIRDIAVQYVRTRAPSEQSELITILGDIRDIFDETQAERLYTVDLTERLVAIEGRPWALWPTKVKDRGEYLARLLAPLGIKSTQFRKGRDNLKGYKRKQFENDWARYLPPRKAP